MKYLYNTIIIISDIYLYLSSIFSNKNKNILEGRKKTINYIYEKIPDYEKIIMIHVSSVGEFEQAKPIIEEIKKSFLHKILVTYFSSSAEIAISNFKHVDYNCYLPSDKKSSIKKIFELINPKVILLIKYEFWRNLIVEAEKKSIPVISVSSVFRKNQIYFRFYGGFFKKILRKVSLFLVQNKESLDLLKKININNVKIVGDTRYDRVIKIFNHSKSYSLIEEFTKNKKTIVIGSSWKSDIEILKKEIIRDLTETKYIIVPHNINKSEINYLEKQFINDTIKYSDLPQKTIKKRILIIDEFGMLSSIYRYSDIAFIGGGFRGATHNTLEAAVWDVPVIYGLNKNNNKFIEIKKLEKNNIGFPIKNGNEFRLLISRMIKYKDIGKGGNKFIINNSGATAKIIHHISKKL